VVGDSNRVTRNIFLTSGGLVLRGGGSSNRVDHNEIATPPGRGIDIALKLSGNDKRQARDNLFDHNLFRSRGAGDVGGASREEDGDGATGRARGGRASASTSASSAPARAGKR
jgi:hypothetical protein